MQKEILYAFIQSRSTYDKLSKFVGEDDFEGVLRVIYKDIQEYYESDPSAVGADPTLLREGLHNKYPRFEEDINIVMDSYKEGSLSNIERVFIEGKRTVLGNKISSELLAGNISDARKLMDEFYGYDSLDVLEAENVTEFVGDRELLKRVVEKREKAEFRLRPKTIQERTGGANRKHHILIFGRPNCIVGDMKLQVSRGRRIAKSSSREYTLEHLYKLWKRSPIDTYVKSMKEDDTTIAFKRVVDVSDSGIKDCLDIRLATTNIQTSTCHRIYTDCGWVRADALKVGDKVAVHKKVPYTHTKLPHKGKELVTKLPNSTYGTRRVGNNVYHRVKLHRLAYDAHLNGMSVEEFVQELKAEKPEGNLVFSDRSLDVHHKDGNPNNNSPNNLELLTRSEHLKKHSPNEYFGQNTIVYEEVSSIEDIGKQQCYDIEMAEDPTFVANDVVVHNSGKTLLVIANVAGWLRDGHRVLYLGNEDPPDDVLERLVCNLANVDKVDLHANREHLVDVAFDRGMDNLIFKELTPGNFYEIRQQVEKHKPDIVIIDQIRNVNVKADGMTQRLEAAAMQARNIAKKYNCLVVSVTQAGECATNKRVLEMEDVDSSKTGIQAALNVMIGVGFTKEEEKSGRRWISLRKNKLGTYDYQFPIKIDPHRSKAGSVQ